MELGSHGRRGFSVLDSRLQRFSSLFENGDNFAFAKTAGNQLESTLRIDVDLIEQRE